MAAVRAAVRGGSTLSAEIVRSVLAAGGIEVTDRLGPGVVLVLVEPDAEHWNEVRHHEAPAVLVKGDLDDDDVLDGIRRGANAVLELASATTKVVATVTELAAGGAVLTSRQTRILVEALRRGAGGEEPIRLTPRERDILASIEVGHSVKQTARHLGISPKTVENLQSRLFRKLDVRNRAQAVAVAHRYGLLDRDDEATG